MNDHAPADIIDVAAAPPDNPMPPLGLLNRLRRLWIRVASPARYERLDGSLRVATIEIEQRGDPHAPRHLAIDRGGDLLGDRGWKASALRLLRESRAALESGKIDQAWKLLHAARRMELLGVTDPAELKTITAALRVEALKLKRWRRDAILAILGKDDTAAVPSAALVHAAELRDDQYDNQGHKSLLLGTQVLFLAGVLAAVMGGLMALSYRGVLPFGDPPTSFHTLLAVMLFGNLGGTISSIVRASAPGESVRIPEIAKANRVSFLRILMGGASAVVIYLALRSQLAGLLPQPLAAAMNETTMYTTYAIAVASGFTERFVIRAVEFMVGKQDKDDTAPPAKDDSDG